MKKTVKIMMSCCMLFALSACVKNKVEDESKPNDDTNIVIKDPNKDVIVKEEENKENKDETPVDSKEEGVVKPEEKPVAPEAKPEAKPEVKPEPKPEPKPDVKPEEKPEVLVDLKALADQIKATDIFKMNADFDATQISDLYSGLSANEYSEAIVFKNQLSPGGDEVAIFKAQTGSVDLVLKGVKARDDYGKNEGAFYPMEQEMFNNSMTLQFGDYVIYIAARNVEDVASLVNAMFVK